MAEIIPFRKPRRRGIRSEARSQMTDAFHAVGQPDAVCVVALGQDGQFALRMAHCDSMHTIDLLGRAALLIQNEAAALIEEV